MCVCTYIFTYVRISHMVINIHSIMLIHTTEGVVDWFTAVHAPHQSPSKHFSCVTLTNARIWAIITTQVSGTMEGTTGVWVWVNKPVLVTAHMYVTACNNNFVPFCLRGLALAVCVHLLDIWQYWIASPHLSPLLHARTCTYVWMSHVHICGCLIWRQVVLLYRFPLTVVYITHNHFCHFKVAHWPQSGSQKTRHRWSTSNYPNMYNWAPQC